MLVHSTAIHHECHDTLPTEMDGCYTCPRPKRLIPKLHLQIKLLCSTDVSLRDTANLLGDTSLHRPSPRVSTAKRVTVAEVGRLVSRAIYNNGPCWEYNHISLQPCQADSEKHRNKMATTQTEVAFRLTDSSYNREKHSFDLNIHTWSSMQYALRALRASREDNTWSFIATLQPPALEQCDSSMTSQQLVRHLLPVLI